MSQIVEADALQPRSGERRFESLTQPQVVDVAAVLVDEHEVVGICEPLAAAQRFQRLRRLVDQRHAPDPTRLRDAVRAMREVAPHMHEVLREVDVHPPERAKLAEPQAGERGDAEDGGVLVVVGGAGERLDLGGSEEREIA